MDARLNPYGLLSFGGLAGGWSRSTPAGDPDRLPTALDEVAAALGCAGVTAARRARHAAQRDAYTAWWTDFTARSGWAVKRGLYRPEQPALPLPLPPGPGRLAGRSTVIGPMLRCSAGRYDRRCLPDEWSSSRSFVR
jgi:hypothetical protein